MPYPLVSVVIPNYNCAPYVGAAIESVLKQTFHDFEVLVVDDGSKDDSRDVIARYGPPVRAIHQANAGVSVARNHGIEESRGEFVAFLDSDDTWMPEKLEKQVTALRGAPEAGVCYSAFLVVDNELRPLEVRRSQRRASALEDLLFIGNVVGSICTVMVRRELLGKVGGFDAALSTCADWDMWVRLARHGEFLYLDESLVTYRQHGAQMMGNIPRLESDSLRVLEKGFADPGTPADLRARSARALGHNWMVLAGSYFKVGRSRDFLRCAVRSLLADPGQSARLLNYPLRRAQRARNAW